MSYGAPSQSPPGGIDFGIVSEAFTLLTEHWKVYTVAGLVVLVASAPNQILTIPQSLGEAGLIEWTGWTAAPYGVLSISLTLITYLFQALMAAGVTCYTLNVIRGLPASPSDIWIGFKDPLGYVWLMILSGIVGLLGSGDAFVSGGEPRAFRAPPTAPSRASIYVTTFSFASYSARSARFRRVAVQGLRRCRDREQAPGSSTR